MVKTEKPNPKVSHVLVITILSCLHPWYGTCTNSAPPKERALERDYYMTGRVGFPCAVYSQTLNPDTAEEAKDFGIVDGILEKRPASETDRPQ